MRARERKRESKREREREREREKCLAAEKMKIQTLKRLKAFIYLFILYLWQGIG